MNVRYIKDSNNVLTEKADRLPVGNESLFEWAHDLNLKDLNGVCLYEVKSNKPVLRDITADPDNVREYLKQKDADLMALIFPAIIKGKRTLDECIIKYAEFTTGAPTWGTIQKINTAFDSAVVWLEG